MENTRSKRRGDGIQWGEAGRKDRHGRQWSRTITWKRESRCYDYGWLSQNYCRLLYVKVENR